MDWGNFLGELCLFLAGVFSGIGIGLALRRKA